MIKVIKKPSLSEIVILFLLVVILILSVDIHFQINKLDEAINELSVVVDEINREGTINKIEKEAYQIENVALLNKIAELEELTNELSLALDESFEREKTTLKYFRSFLNHLHKGAEENIDE